jgi:hypothetical protein
MTDDWKTLAKARAPIEERIEALVRIVRAALDADAGTRADATELDVLCTAFVDEVVRSGKVKPALDDAASRASRTAVVPARPDTGGPRARGPSELICKPYEARSAIPPILYALAHRSHANRELARWLFEAAKLWSHERDHALAALGRARVEPEILADGIDALAAFAGARPDPGGDILRDVARTWLARPGWLLALVDRVARDRAAADALADGLYGDDLAGAAGAGADAARAEWLQHATHAPSGARAVALGMLAHVGGNDGGDRSDRDGDNNGLEAVILAALDDRDAHGRVIEAAARLTLARSVWSRAVVEAAERCRAARPAEGRVEVQVAEALDALLRSGAAALAPPPTETAGARLSIVEGPFVCNGLAFAGALAVAGYRRPVTLAPQSDWRTDDDELGLAVVGPGVAARHVSPVRFAARATGGSGVRRSIDLVGVLDGRAVLAITSPFSDERGWGNDNYALGCDPAAGTWVAYREDGGRLVVAGELAGEVPEAELPRLCHGEAIVWLDAGVAHVVADGTPYHLDDWEIDDAVSAALEARRQARARTPWTALELGGDAAWTFRGGGRSVHLADFGAELAAAWPAYRDDTDFALTAAAHGADLALAIQHHVPALRGALIWRAASW